MGTFTRILVPLDLVSDTKGAMAYATELARRFDAEVVLLHLHEFVSVAPEEEVHEAQRTLADLAAGLEAEGIGCRTLSRMLEIPTISASDVIVDVAGHERADLIVMSTHGRTGLTRILLGSVTEEVLRVAPCPVLAVHDKDRVSS